MKKLFMITILLVGVLFFNCSVLGKEYVKSSRYKSENPIANVDDVILNNDANPTSLDVADNSQYGIIPYFQNLYAYSPINSYGSCGYVSLIQYLSYYDTYWDDDMIPESYDRNQGNTTSIDEAVAISPGVLRQSYPKYDLYSFIQANKSIDFQMYLMDIVNKAKGNVSNDYDYSIGMWDYYLIFDELYGNISFDYTRVENLGFGLDPSNPFIVSWADTYVKNQLDLGKPVILHIVKKDNYDLYHSVCSYYYDNQGIHTNLGWGEEDNDVIIDSDYLITEVGVMDLTNVPEKHSNNYIINGNQYCGCGSLHIHTFIDHYCWCGEYSSMHTYHAPYVWENYTTHYATCGCGAVELSAHVVKKGTIGVNNKYAMCLLCKGLASIGMVAYDSLDSKITYFTNNGSFIMPNGVVVLDDKDMSLLIANKLVFFKLQYL